MTTSDRISPADQRGARNRRGVPYGWIAVGVALVALFVTALFVMWPGGPAGNAPQDAQNTAQAAPPVRLGVRLTLVTEAVGEDAAAVVRLYNARARLDEAVRDATAPGREWRGTIDGDGARAVELQMGPDSWRSVLSVERLDEQERAAPLPGDAISIVSAPEGSLAFTRADTHSVTLALRGDAVPPPGGRLRVRVTHADVSGESNTVVVAVPPAAGVELLTRRARVAELLRRVDRLAATADEIVAASPTNPLGYWYRGVALESRGDTAGALEAYQAASARITPGGQEPPIGLDLRIARLRSR